MKPEAKKVDFHYNAVIAHSGCTKDALATVGTCRCANPNLRI